MKKTIRKAEPDSPAKSVTPTLKEVELMIPDNSTDRTSLVLLFDVRNPEQIEVLHYWRAAFAAATDLEAVDENIFALHIRPGVCACGGAA